MDNGDMGKLEETTSTEILNNANKGVSVPNAEEYPQVIGHESGGFFFSRICRVLIHDNTKKHLHQFMDYFN